MEYALDDGMGVKVRWSAVSSRTWMHLKGSGEETLRRSHVQRSGQGYDTNTGWGSIQGTDEQGAIITPVLRTERSSPETWCQL